MGNADTMYFRSALLVDFDNIYSTFASTNPTIADTFGKDPRRWHDWFQYQLGAVGPLADEETPRVILERICYLNPSRYQKFRAYFTRAGFRVVDCPSLT